MNNIYILDEVNFERKINKIKLDGCVNLHIISDWDSTLTNKFFNGGRVGSSFAKLKNNSHLDDDYFSEAESLRREYNPIQLTGDVSLEFKSKKMLEWWEKHLKLLIRSGMNRNIITDIVDKKEIHPREGLIEFLDILQKNKIPILIFSAGLGDFIKEFLISEKKLTDNVDVISNFFKFNESGKAIDYDKSIVHTFNKKEIFISDFFDNKKIKNRKNVILLGDSIEDAEIINDANNDCVVKIGFLNDDAAELLDIYSKNFDVLILNDSSMEYVNNLLREIN